MKDRDFLKSCLIFTCLSQRNKCLTFIWSDDRFYKNELCFSQNTISDEKLKEFILNNTDKSIISLRENILEDAKKTKNYKNNYTYWLYQVIQELNTYLYNSKSYTKEELKSLSLNKVNTNSFVFSGYCSVSLWLNKYDNTSNNAIFTALL